MMPPSDILRAGLSLLPAVLRRPVAWALLRSALSALEGARARADAAHRGEPRGTRYRLVHTGQVCSLESLLNDRHDPALRRVRVGDGAGAERWWLYTGGELRLQPALATSLGGGDDPRWLRPDADHQGGPGAGFVVSAPRALRAQEASLRASVDDMRVAGTTYAVEYF